MTDVINYSIIIYRVRSYIPFISKQERMKAMRFCGNCGAALQEDARFCPKCGSEGVGQAVMQSMPVGAAAVPYPMPNQNARKKKRRIITAVVVGVIVAVLLLQVPQMRNLLKINNKNK